MRLFKRKPKPLDMPEIEKTEPATLDSITQKLQNYTATQGRASFGSLSPYSVEELVESAKNKNGKHSSTSKTEETAA